MLCAVRLAPRCDECVTDGVCGACADHGGVTHKRQSWRAKASYAACVRVTVLPLQRWYRSFPFASRASLGIPRIAPCARWHNQSVYRNHRYSSAQLALARIRQDRLSMLAVHKTQRLRRLDCSCRKPKHLAVQARCIRWGSFCPL
jgi:hypothetical protein